MASNIIHFNAHEGSLVHAALEAFAEQQATEVDASSGAEAMGRQSYATIAWRIAAEIKQANQPGDWGHWELRWCEKEK